MVITGILRSGGDTKVPLYIESALIWCGGVPLTFCVCLASAAPIHLAVLATYVWELPKLWLVLRRMRKGAWLQTVAR